MLALASTGIAVAIFLLTGEGRDAGTVTIKDARIVSVLIFVIAHAFSVGTFIVLCVFGGRSIGHGVLRGDRLLHLWRAPTPLTNGPAHGDKRQPERNRQTGRS